MHDAVAEGALIDSVLAILDVARGGSRPFLTIQFDCCTAYYTHDVE